MAGKWSNFAKSLGKGVIWGLTFILDHPEIVQIALDAQKKAKREG